MISALTANNELRRFSRSNMGKATLVSITLMPLLYSTLYLWSFWNPFGNLGELPVALVNNDQGTVVEGQQLNAGSQVTAGLLDDRTLNWQEVSEQEAIDGVRDGTYYFSVELPENFSEAVASPTSDNPEQATLLATYNDRNGYLSTVIGENAMRVMLNTVSDTIGSQAVDRLLVGMLNAGLGVGMAADGADELADGAEQLRDGLFQLQDGSGQLLDSINQLNDGTGQLSAGAGELSSGASELAAGTDELAAAVNDASGAFEQLRDGAEAMSGSLESAGEVAAGANTAVSGVVGAAETASGVQGSTADDIRGIADQLRGINEPTVQQAVAAIDGLADQVASTGLGPNSDLLAELRGVGTTVGDLDYQLNNPAAPLRGTVDAMASGDSQIDELVSGVNQLNEGANQLSAGASELADGANQLNDGAGQLQDGAAQLNDGLGEAADGSVELADGANQLADGLRDGMSAIPQWDPMQRQEVASVMGGPVAVNEENTAGTNTFGAGLAPLFFSMALYMGGLVIYLVLKPMQQRQIGAGVRPLRAAIDSLLPGSLISFLQALAIVGVTMAVTPFRPDSVVAVVAFALLVGLMYAAINQALHAALGPGPGRVTSLSFMMIQMVSSGGMYPPETQPMLLQWIHPFMPMTYAVDGFRQVMYGTYDARLLGSILMVLLFLAIAVAISAATAARDRTWSMSRLHPAVDV